MAKRILVTGAATGCGRGMALALAKRGHTVIAGAQIAPQVTELMKIADEAEVGELSGAAAPSTGSGQACLRALRLPGLPPAPGRRPPRRLGLEAGGWLLAVEVMAARGAPLR